MSLRDLFPAENMRGWYAHLTNQGAHGGLVGVGAALALSPLLSAVACFWAIVLGYGIGWELLVQRGRDWRDSLEDTAHVTAGGAVLLAALQHVHAVDFWAAWGGAALAFAGWCALLVLGVWRRFPT
jgi:hypothetical protein